jgi:hypothetical protein
MAINCYWMLPEFHCHQMLPYVWLYQSDQKQLFLFGDYDFCRRSTLGPSDDDL